MPMIERWKRRAKWVAHCARAVLSGHAVHCPCCGGCAPDFAPLLDPGGPVEADLLRVGFDLRLLRECETLNASAYACRVCGASDRDRLVALFLREWLAARPRRPRPRLLDVGPSNALRAFVRGTRRFDYRSADLLRDDVDDRGVDLQALPYADGAFDFVLCSHVLEHVPDDRKALRSLRRVLRPGGAGVVMSPIVLTLEATREDPDLEDEDERTRRFGQRDHLRLYARADFVARLREAGFTVEEVPATRFDAGELTRAGVQRRAVLYVVGRDPGGAAGSPR